MKQYWSVADDAKELTEAARDLNPPSIGVEGRPGCAPKLARVDSVWCARGEQGAHQPQVEGEGS